MREGRSASGSTWPYTDKMKGGFLLIDKPLGWTSHDVVAKVRQITGVQKVGHGGTLDPLATGLLVVGIGAATKQLEQFVQGDKSYVATVRLGESSTTDDAEGELTEQSSEPPTLERVGTALAFFRGKQQQLPPNFAALKTKGRKYYHLARQGLFVPRQTREVTFHELELLDYTWPDVTLCTVVSKGTYIRALARDLGAKLATGGYLVALRRMAIGDLSVDQAMTMETVVDEWQNQLISL